MLKHLYIKNYALIDDLEIDFERGLNILTGETGTGKSILIGAIALILGGRSGKDVIRRTELKAVVEAEFIVEKKEPLLILLQNQQVEWSDTLLIRREISPAGQSRCFVNDTPVTLKVLKEVGELLVDLHGQHEHQSLLRTDTHQKLLDDFGGLSGIVSEYYHTYQSIRSLFEELNQLRTREKTLKEKKEILEFQIKEIDDLNPQPGEDEDLKTELNILENGEVLFDHTRHLYELLYEGNGSVYELLVLARNKLKIIADIDPSFSDIKQETESAENIIAEISKFLQGYNSRIEFDPERLEIIRDRLGKLSLLKKKYGGSVDSIMEHREKFGEEYQLAGNFEQSLKALSERIREERTKLSRVAMQLSEKRKECSHRLEHLVVMQLKKLGIPNAKFNVRSEVKQDVTGRLNEGNVYIEWGDKYYHAYPYGIDQIEFYVSTNLGEEPKPLSKVASGGEISRIMLALKSILAKNERLPLLIFDEIDVGVSGRIAQAVGRSISQLSNYHQIIAITHLPQIAGLADTHFKVEKEEKKEGTTTRVRRLELNERVEEVARLMSGEEITKAGIIGARELMKI